ncbi:MAG: chromate resistance protein ChrB domain-containing protein [Ignavibacteriales bacterium]
MKWIFLVHQMQTPNSSERVKVWRLTKKVGAVFYRNSVYVLPYSKEQLEDFQWLCQQIKDSKGEASIFISESQDENEDRTIRSLFERSRQEDYSAILTSAKGLLERIRRAKQRKQPVESLLKKLAKEARHLNKSFTDIERIDFFSAPLTNEVRSIIEQIANHFTSSQPQRESLASLKRYSPKEFQQKVWATRENIHIDRLCSAWLIRRFIDPQARFVFAPESNLPKDAIQFDIFGAEFSHHGEDCTFETFLKSFQLKDKALISIGEIVHDVDMKDHKFGRLESAGLDAVVRALSNSLGDDHKVLEIGSTILDALYLYFSSTKQQRR